MQTKEIQTQTCFMFPSFFIFSHWFTRRDKLPSPYVCLHITCVLKKSLSIWMLSMLTYDPTHDACLHICLQSWVHACLHAYEINASRLSYQYEYVDLQRTVSKSIRSFKRYIPESWSDATGICQNLTRMFKMQMSPKRKLWALKKRNLEKSILVHSRTGM